MLIWLEDIFNSALKPLGGLTPWDLYKLWVLYKVIGWTFIGLAGGVYFLWKMMTG